MSRTGKGWVMRGKDRITLFEIHSCIYRRDFAYPVRKTSPIYIGKHGYKQCTPMPTGLPIYTGGILRTPTQNLSYIYRKDFACPTQNPSYIYRRDFAYPYAKPLLYIKSIIYIYRRDFAYPYAKPLLYIQERFCVPYAKS